MGKKAATLQTDIKQTPGFFLGAVGFAMSVLVKEAPVIDSFYSTPEESSTLMVFTISAAVFAVLLLAYRKFPELRLCRRVMASAIIAVVTSFALFLLYKQGTILVSPSFEFIFRAIINVGGYLLLIMWCELIHALGSRKCAYMFAAALMMITVFCLISIMLKTEAVASVIALCPLVSTICLHYFKEKTGMGTNALQLKFERSEVYPLGAGYVVKREHVALLAAFAVFIVCCRMSFSSVFFLQSGMQMVFASSLATLLLNGAGLFVAGVAILICARFLWGKHALAVISVFVLAAVFFSMNPNGILPADMTVVLTLPMSAGEILVCFLIIESPFLMDAQKPYATICTLILFSLLGVLLNTVFSLFFSAELSRAVAVIFVVAVVACIVYFFVIVGYGEKKTLPIAEAMPNATPTVQGTIATLDIDLRASCERLAWECRLTDREMDVLFLLANRYSTQDIAELLVLSVSTVKTHMRNVYRKIDVHSQKELQDLVLGNTTRL